ncbi:MAG: hypothetical protein GY866_14085 [Proteobacteria bacterium]|nr:hypothetical protein [Pseudomonadota bacterium]
MNTIITVVAILMVSDAAFTLLNLSKVESFLNKAFPKMNVRKLAMVEGVVGMVIIIIKISTKTIM